MDYKSGIFDYIESQRENMIGTLSELISYPSRLSAPEPKAPFGKAVAGCLEKALEIMSGFGFKTRNFDGYVGTALMGDNAELGILAHLDVVPEGSGWTTDPYKAAVKGGKVFGRGAIDDKGPAVAVMYAMKAIRELGIPLKTGVKLILGTNEENGSEDLKYYFSKEAPTKYTFTPDGSYPVINIEKGRILASITADSQPSPSSRVLVELKGGTVANAVPESAYALVSGVDEKEIENAISGFDGKVEFSFKRLGGCMRIDSSGKSAHASTPDIGQNAITAILELISHLNLQDDASKKIKSLSELFPFGDNSGRGAKIDCSDELSGSLTCVLSIISYELGHLECKLDIRIPASFKYGDTASKLKSSIESSGFNAAEISGADPHFVSPDSHFVKTLLSVYEDVTGEKGGCIAIGGGTYVHEIEGGVAFGAEFAGEDNHMHSADEFITVDDLILNAKMFAMAILKICGE